LQRRALPCRVGRLLQCVQALLQLRPRGLQLLDRALQSLVLLVQQRVVLHQVVEVPQQHVLPEPGHAHTAAARPRLLGLLPQRLHGVLQELHLPLQRRDRAVLVAALRAELLQLLLRPDGVPLPLLTLLLDGLDHGPQALGFLRLPLRLLPVPRALLPLLLRLLPVPRGLLPLLLRHLPLPRSLLPLQLRHLPVPRHLPPPLLGLHLLPHLGVPEPLELRPALVRLLHQLPQVLLLLLQRGPVLLQRALPRHHRALPAHELLLSGRHLVLPRRNLRLQVRRRLQPRAPGLHHRGLRHLQLVLSRSHERLPLPEGLQLRLQRGLARLELRAALPEHRVPDLHVVRGLPQLSLLPLQVARAPLRLRVARLSLVQAVLDRCDLGLVLRGLLPQLPALRQAAVQRGLQLLHRGVAVPQLRPERRRGLPLPQQQLVLGLEGADLVLELLLLVPHRRSAGRALFGRQALPPPRLRLQVVDAQLQLGDRVLLRLGAGLQQRALAAGLLELVGGPAGGLRRLHVLLPQLLQALLQLRLEARELLLLRLMRL